MDLRRESQYRELAERMKRQKKLKNAMDHVQVQRNLMVSSEPLLQRTRPSAEIQQKSCRQALYPGGTVFRASPSLLCPHPLLL
jgi:hypothetical protein